MDPLSAIAAGSSLLGSLFNGITSASNTKSTNKTNMQIARETNDMSMAIARENNAAQLAALRENNEFARSQALEMFNLENEYNTPAAQKQRLLAAGLNPATFYGQGAQVVNSGDIATPQAQSSGVTSSMPSLVTPTLQTPPSVIGAMFSSFSQAASALRDLSSSDLNKAQSDKIVKLMEGELGKLLSEKDLNAARAKVENVQAQLLEVYGKAKNKAEVQRLIAAASKDLQEALLAQSRNDTEKANKLIADFEAKIRSKNLEVLSEKAPLIIQEAQESVNLIKEKQRTEQSMQASNYASAEESHSRAQLTDEQFDQLHKMSWDNVHIQRYLHYEKSLDYMRLRQTLNDQIKVYRNQNLLTQAQIDNIMQDASRKEKENSAFWFSYVFDKLERTAKGAAAFIPFTNPHGSSDEGSQRFYTPSWSTSTTNP